MDRARRKFVRTALGAGAGAALAWRVGWAADGGSGGLAEGPLKILILGGTSFLVPRSSRRDRARHTLTLFNRGKTNPASSRASRSSAATAMATSGPRAQVLDAVVDTRATCADRLRVGDATRPSVRHYVFISTISVFATASGPAPTRARPRDDARRDE